MRYFTEAHTLPDHRPHTVRWYARVTIHSGPLDDGETQKFHLSYYRGPDRPVLRLEATQESWGFLVGLCADLLEWMRFHDDQTTPLVYLIPALESMGYVRYEEQTNGPG